MWPLASFHKTSHTHKALLHHGLQNLHIAAAEAGTESFSEVFAHVRGHIDANFVTQCGYTHWEAEGCGESIQLLGVDSFLWRHINRDDPGCMFASCVKTADSSALSANRFLCCCLPEELSLLQSGRVQGTSSCRNQVHPAEKPKPLFTDELESQEGENDESQHVCFASKRNKVLNILTRPLLLCSWDHVFGSLRLTPTTIMTLPCFRPTATAEATVSLDVCSVVMISRSCILSTGEK